MLDQQKVAEMQTPTEFPQHERLTRVLNIYRAAMRRHIMEQWSAKYPDDWFARLFKNLDEREQKEIEANRDRIRSRMGEGKLTLSADEENQRVMDIPVFLNAVKDRQDLFHKLTEPACADDIYHLYQIRNQWAHPPLRDLSKPEVDHAIQRCANVLEVFDEDARDAVLNLFEARGESSSCEAAQEQLSEIRNLLGPVERQRETLASLYGTMSSLQNDVSDIKGRLNKDMTDDSRREDSTKQLQELIANIEPAVSARLQTILEPLLTQISDIRNEASETQD